jgi:YVTN family beta-propeller protein
MHRTLVAILLLLACNATADTLLVVNKRDATLALVDPVAMKVTGKVATGKEPHEVAVSDDGKIAVVCNYARGANSLTVIDVGEKREVRQFALPGLAQPHGIQAVGSRFYITAEGSLAVARYDVAADRIDWIAGTGQDVTHMLLVTPDEKKIYTANIGSNSVSIIDLSNAPRWIDVKQLAVGRGPEGMDLSPDGTALWVAGVASPKEAARISVIDPKTDSIVRTIPTGTKLANRLRFAPDGTRVAVSDPGTNEVWIFDAATGDVVKKIPTAAGPAGILFTPDGKRLFVACADAGKVQVIDTATWSITGEIETGAEPDGMAYARN